MSASNRTTKKTKKFW